MSILPSCDMNYYRCYWFSEIEGVQREVDILISHTDMNHARMVASWYVTNIAHFDDYPINIKEFGSPCFVINHEWNSIQIISSIFTIKQAFKLLTDIGMEITNINSLNNPLDSYLQRIILGMLRKTYGLSNDDPFTMEVEEDIMVDGRFTPTQLIKITDLITHILTDAKELYVKTKWIIGGDNMTIFIKSIEILQQTLNQWDIINAKEQTKKLIGVMEDVEWEYIEYERARDHQVQNQITIPNLNNILAHNQWVSAHKLYELHSSESKKIEQRYQTIYRKVLLKRVTYITWVRGEMSSTVWSRESILHFFIRKFEYMLIFMSYIIAIILESKWNYRYRWNTLYIIWLIGLVFQFTHLIHTRYRYFKLVFLVGWFIFVGILWYFIASNLALI